jgi:N-acetyl-gamma-glutamyl-phosphate reductase
MIWVGILGAKGYLGDALERLVAGHPEAQVSTVMEMSEAVDGSDCMSGSVEDRPGYWCMMNAVRKSDIIFSGLTGNTAEKVYSEALSWGKRIIDIGYMRNSAYPGSVYGLSELYRDKMKDAAMVVNPSSYCAGAILGLAPLAVSKVADMNTAAIESRSGITSLRKTDKLIDLGAVNHTGVKTYKLECRDYAEEVNEQMHILFGEKASADYSSYIIPGERGITTTININPCSEVYVGDILDIYKDFYKANPFIGICSKGTTPEIKNSFGRCFCKIGASVDKDTGRITVTTVLDDALRGVASQAIQSMNLMYGIDGNIGL